MLFALFAGLPGACGCYKLLSQRITAELRLDRVIYNRTPLNIYNFLDEADLITSKKACQHIIRSINYCSLLDKKGIGIIINMLDIVTSLQAADKIINI